jgi:hypothetical protein
VEQANEARKPCARISRGRVTLRWWGIPCFLFFWAPLKLVLTAHPLFFTGTHLFCRERLSRLYRSPGFSKPPFRESSRNGGGRWRDHPCTARLRDKQATRIMAGTEDLGWNFCEVKRGPEAPQLHLMRCSDGMFLWGAGATLGVA